MGSLRIFLIYFDHFISDSVMYYSLSISLSPHLLLYLKENKDFSFLFLDFFDFSFPAPDSPSVCLCATLAIYFVLPSLLVFSM